MNKYSVDLTQVTKTVYRANIEAENEQEARELASDDFFDYDFDIVYEDVIEDYISIEGDIYENEESES